MGTARLAIGQEQQGPGPEPDQRGNSPKKSVTSEICTLKDTTLLDPFSGWGWLFVLFC